MAHEFAGENELLLHKRIVDCGQIERNLRQRIKEMEEDVDARRRAMAQEIADTLRQRGHWVPADPNSSDLILAVGRAFDKVEATANELASQRTALLEMTRLLDEHPEEYEGECWCRLCLSYVDCEGLDFGRASEGGE